MKVHRLRATETVIADSGAVLCLVTELADEALAQTLTSLAEAGPEAPIFIVHPGSSCGEVESFLSPMSLNVEVFCLEDKTRDEGGFDAMRSISDSTGRADIAVLFAGSLVAEGWLSGLRDAAYSDTTVATAIPLTDGEGFASIRHLIGASLEKTDFAEIASRVQSASPRSFPKVPAPLGPCVFIRRQAIEVVGLGEAFKSVIGGILDFSHRCTLHALSHAVADQVLMLSTHLPQPTHSEELLLRRLYPYYLESERLWLAEPSEMLMQATDRARKAVRGSDPLSVTIDGSCLLEEPTGTQVHVLELLHALWQTKQVDLRVIVPAKSGDYARRAIAKMDGLEVVVWDEIDGTIRRTDVVHRPWQVRRPMEMGVLRQTAHRLVVTQQDLIEWRNPSNFVNFGDWQTARSVMRRSAEAASIVLFFSKHASEDAIREGLIERDRARVVYLGTDHNVLPLPPESPIKGVSERLETGPFLVCLGNDFRHKNRMFALRLLHQLQLRHGWAGLLVLVGPRVARASSHEDEEAFLVNQPKVRSAVIRLAMVTESEKSWLLRHAKLAIYPSLYEGFGLVPFEAASAGTATVFAPSASLGELFPPEATTIVAWDPASSADRVMEVLSDDEKRKQLLERIRSAAAGLSWSATADSVLRVYREADESAPRRSFFIPDQDASWLFSGVLTERAEEALRAIVARRVLAKPFFGLLVFLYRPIRRLYRRLGRRFGPSL